MLTLLLTNIYINVSRTDSIKCFSTLSIIFRFQLRLEYFIAAAIAIIIILILVLVIVAVLLIRVCRNRSALNDSSTGSSFSEAGCAQVKSSCHSFAIKLKFGMFFLIEYCTLFIESHELKTHFLAVPDLL